MPINNPFDQKALEALMRQNLRENPPSIEEGARPLPDDVMPIDQFQGPQLPMGPEKPKGRPHWLMHLANLGSAGYDAYQSDQMRQWNENEAGKTWAGITTDANGKPKINLSTTPDLPVGSMMGDNPSRGRVYGQTLGMAALNSLLAHFMPKKLGNISLGVNTLMNAGMGGVKQWGRGKVESSLDDYRTKNNMVELPGIKLPRK